MLYLQPSLSLWEETVTKKKEAKPKKTLQKLESTLTLNTNDENHSKRKSISSQQMQGDF